MHPPTPGGGCRDSEAPRAGGSGRFGGCFARFLRSSGARGRGEAYDCAGSGVDLDGDRRSEANRLSAYAFEGGEACPPGVCFEFEVGGYFDPVLSRGLLADPEREGLEEESLGSTLGGDPRVKRGGLTSSVRGHSLPFGWTFQFRDVLLIGGAGAEFPRVRLHSRWEGRKFAGSISR